MHQEIARAGLMIGCLLLVGGVPLLLFSQPGTAEYVITIFTVLLGAVFIVVIGITVRRRQR